MTLQLRDTTDGMVYVGRYITLECHIRLNEAISRREVNVAVTWTKGTLKISNSTRTHIMTVDGSSVLRSTLSFRPIVSTDSGQYRCAATLTSQRGTSTPEVTAYSSKQLTVHGSLVPRLLPSHTIIPRMTSDPPVHGMYMVQYFDVP